MNDQVFRTEFELNLLYGMSNNFVFNLKSATQKG